MKTVNGFDHIRLDMGDLDFPGHEERILAHLKGRIVPGHNPADMLIDPVTRAFVEERGCYVAALALLHRMAPEVDVIECHAPDETIAVTTWRETITSPWQLSLAIRLGNGDATWGPNGIDYIDLPDTLSNCVAGMALSRVVSHPLLDGHRAVVVSHTILELKVRTAPPTRIYPESP